MEPCVQSAGFSAGNGKPAPTDSEEGTADTNGTTDRYTEQTKQNSSEHAEDHGHRTEENQTDFEHKLDENKTKLKTQNVSKKQEIGVVFNY